VLISGPNKADDTCAKTMVTGTRFHCILYRNVCIKVKFTLEHEGPEGEERYSSTISLTSVLDGGGWSTPRHLCPWE
jgi:hypothetical protein